MQSAQIDAAMSQFLLGIFFQIANPKANHVIPVALKPSGIIKLAM